MKGDSPHLDGFHFVSTENGLLDRFWVFDRLKRTYWGERYTEESLNRAIEHSLCFGLFECRPVDAGRTSPNKQVGFARIVTDHSLFSSLLDFYIERECRGKGLGHYLMEKVLTHPSVAPTLNVLGTRDAHRFYAKFEYQEFTAMKRNPSKKR